MRKVSRPLFTAEIQHLKRMGMDTARQETTPSGPAAARRTARTARPGRGQGDADAEVLQVVQSLRDDLRGLEALVREALGKSDDEGEAARDDRASEALAREEASLQQRREEVDLLRMELHALSRSINETKQEIAALRPQGGEDDRITAVTHELDAVVGATESATQSILDCAEAVDSLSNAIKTQTKDDNIAHMADEVGEQVIRIFEACNFQDITGQRITKVVNTLKFIEERVEKMIDIWGRESFSGTEPPPAVAAAKPDKDAALLNGPQLGNKGISQEEIDNLFD